MYTSKKSIENHLCLIFDTFFIYYNTLFFIHDLEHIEFQVLRFNPLILLAFRLVIASSTPLLHHFSYKSHFFFKCIFFHMTIQVHCHL